MSITNGYATLAEVKAASASVAAHGTANDTVLERCIEAASRGVDQLVEDIKNEAMTRSKREETT